MPKKEPVRLSTWSKSMAQDKVMLPLGKTFMPHVGAALLFVGGFAPGAWSQTAQSGSHSAHSHAVAAERLGKVEFKVDCNTEAQGEFNRAMALYHSFWWPAASKAFEAVAQADPTCGMAHWGRAMVILDNPFTWPANLAPKLKDVVAAIEAARSAGLRSQREKDYVEAIAVFVRDHEKVDHRTRLQAYDDAMAEVARRYPDDKEAAILSALVSSANFNPADKTYANQLKAAKSLERFVTSDPDHPGVAHYMIHSYDYPAIAKHGVEAAKIYATIAPNSPHALHMPSHIFTRSATGASRSRRIALRHAWRATPRSTPTTRTITWSMPICSSPRIVPQARRWSVRET